MLDTPCNVACLEIALQTTPQAQMLCLQLYVRGLQGSRLQAGAKRRVVLLSTDASTSWQTKPLCMSPRLASYYAC